MGLHIYMTYGSPEADRFPDIIFIIRAVANPRQHSYCWWMRLDIGRDHSATQHHYANLDPRSCWCSVLVIAAFQSCTAVFFGEMLFTDGEAFSRFVPADQTKSSG